MAFLRAIVLYLLSYFSLQIAFAMALTPGEFSVSPTGGATYEVPIQVPPGTGGMQPELSLTYNHQSGNGLLGIGWSLQGLSIIYRCPSSFAQDGVKSSVNFDVNDRFCMNGQRLVAINGTYGADGTEYRTEIETFSKIISYGHAGIGPASFKVWTKEGTIIEFGGTDDSRIEALNRSEVRVWASNKVTDVTGNYLTVTYDEKNGTGQYCPTKIDYTGNVNAGLVAGRSVRLKSIPRSDVFEQYTSGSIIATDRLISQVETYVGDNLVRSYNLSYGQSSSTNQSRITSIQECASNGDCLPSTVYEYDDSSSGFSQISSLNGLAPAQGFSDSSIYPTITGDWNGDGLTDTGRVGIDRVYTYISTGSGFTPSASLSGLAPAQGFSNTSEYPIFTGDWNGDGRTDIARVGIDRVYVYVSTDSGFSQVNSLIGLAPAQGFSNTSVYPTLIGDWDGDGRTDIARVGIDRIYFYVSTGSGFNQIDSLNGLAPAQGFSNTSDYPILTGEWNGDGITDIARVGIDRIYAYVSSSTGFSQINSLNGLSPAQGFPNTGSYPIFTGDWNGDGLTDVARVGIDRIYTYVSTGLGFAQASSLSGLSISQGFTDSSNYPTLTGDWNGDGRTDIARVGVDRIYAYVSLGNGYSQVDSLVGLASSQGFSDIGVYPIFTGDWDGDGSSDIARVGIDRIYKYISSSNPEYLNLITDGIGARTRIAYESLTSSSVYTKGSDAVYPEIDLQSAQKVVSNYEKSDGLGGMYRVDHRYKGLKAHLLGRGNLGFREFSMDDSRTGLQTSVISRQDFPFVGMSLETRTRLTDGTLLKHVESTSSSTEKGSGLEKIYFIHIDSVEEKIFELDGRLVTSVSKSTEYDEHGNQTQVVSNSNDGYIKTTTNTYSNNIEKWHLGRLTKTMVQSQTPLFGEATRTSSFLYDDVTGLVVQEVIEPDNAALKLVTDFIYDAVGNKVSVTVSAADVGVRTSSTTYEPTYKTFPVSVTNAVGHTETREYDPAFGKRTILTGPNGLTTTWTYDGLGRQINETRADGTHTDRTYIYCNTNCPYGSPYHVEVSTSGTSTSTTYFDELARETKAETIGLDGRSIYKDSVYDQQGRALRVSLPYFEGGAIYWTSYSYDELGRVVSEINQDESRTDITYDGFATTTVNDKGQVTIKVKDSQGQLVESHDDENSVTLYSYDPFGNLINVIDPSANVVSMGYDLRGRKTTMVDPDMGSWSYTYNALGELVKQVDAKNQVMTMEYDALGRLIKRTEPEGVSIWQYDTANMGVGKLAKAIGPSGYEKLHGYDSLGRPDWTNIKINGTPHVVQRTYDNFGRIATLSYPAGLTIRNVYTTHGYLKEVRNAANDELYWQVGSMNAHGQVTIYTLGNGLTTVNNYNPSTNRINSITTGAGTDSSIQNLGYDFDTLGNLESRADLNQNLSETFQYDRLNRLTETNFNGLASKTYQYDSLGNITFKSDVGAYSYAQNGAGPHAVTQTVGTRNNIYTYDANGNQVTGAGRTLTYTSFNKAHTITKGSTIVEYAYDADRNRIKKIKGNDITLYIGKIYEKVLKEGVLEHKQYINAGKMTFAVHSIKGAITETRYMHKDHLGSTDVITDELGNVVERMSFDAHGMRRYSTWQDASIGTVLAGFTTTRGFTGHEMDDETGLVNMNARLYDPVLGRFLTPDTYVQFPENHQSYNRYTYVNNNPLSYTDPSGNFIKNLFKKLKKYIRPLLAAIAFVYVGAFVAITSGNLIVAGLAAGGVSAAILGQNILEGAINGALLAYLTVGKAFSKSPLSGIKESINELSKNLSGAVEHVMYRAKDIALNHAYTKVANKLAQKAGLSLTNFNSILMGSSIAGAVLKGGQTRFKTYDKSDERYYKYSEPKGESRIQVIEGFDNRGKAFLPFDAVDALLVYQGLPTASTRDFLIRGASDIKLYGFSLGAGEVNNLVKQGYASKGEVSSLPFGLLAARKNIQVTNGAGDPISGFIGGLLINPSARTCNVFGHSRALYADAGC